MKILLLNWRDPQNPKSGGAEIVTLEHVKAWVKAGHSIDWLTTKFLRSKNEETKDGIRIIRRGNVITQFFWVPYHYFVSGKKYDLVIDQIHGLPYMTPLFVRKKKLAFIHEVAGDIWDKMFPFPINKFGRLLEKICFLFYKDIPFMTVSESTKSDLKKLGIKNIYVIRNGFTFMPIQPVDKEDIPVFIFISRLVKMKGVEDVIDAFGVIKRELPDAKLWIVGDGEKSYLHFLQDKARKIASEDIIFFGKVSEEKKYTLLRKAHILLHASIKEGWGLVVIEAASQETPAVVYNVSGLRDSVIHNRTGIVVRINTPEEMGRQAIHLYQDKKRLKELQKNSRALAENLTWDNATSKSLALLNSL